MSGARANLQRSRRALEQSEPHVRAWVYVDLESAERAADGVDERQTGDESLQLGGLTVGVKDLIDVAGMPTAGGFLPYAGRIAKADSTVVRRLREVGAVILGKTTTTQFGMTDPTSTRNPWNLAHTPGGSSSGSAAAVAAGHVDLALGSQTGGSVLRPASYCGVVGFKPSVGWIPSDGMLPLAPTLDTVGFLARDVDTIERAHRACTESSASEPEGSAAQTNIGIWMDAVELATPETIEAFNITVKNLAKQGAAVEQTSLTTAYRDMLAVHTVIMMTEAGATHRRLIKRHADSYKPRIRAFAETGMVIPGHYYARALLLRQHLIASLMREWQHYDIVAFPTVEAGAPPADSTGMMTLQGVASLLGFPAISLPMDLDASGLPLGLQLLAPRPAGDRSLLRIARWIESALPGIGTPPGASADPHSTS
jgi:aspartyl-tRNA(Asn)/glutamyl-tRNA(Gln) amidotransferase subunit A